MISDGTQLPTAPVADPELLSVAPGAEVQQGEQRLALQRALGRRLSPAGAPLYFSWVVTIHTKQIGGHKITLPPVRERRALNPEPLRAGARAVGVLDSCAGSALGGLLFV